MNISVKKIESFATKNRVLLRYIAAGLSLLLFVSCLSILFSDIGRLIKSTKALFDGLTGMFTLCLWSFACVFASVYLLILSIGLLMNKEKVVIVALVIGCVSKLISMITLFSFDEFLLDLPYLLFILFMLLSCLSGNSNSIYWGIAAIFAILIDYIIWGSFSLRGFINFIMYPMMVISFGFLCSVTGSRKNLFTGQGNVGHEKIASSNDIDSLLKLKELLDAGIITQEEFEDKKHNLLKL